MVGDWNIIMLQAANNIQDWSQAVYVIDIKSHLSLPHLLAFTGTLPRSTFV